MSSLPLFLASTQQNIVRYGFPIILRLGNICNLFFIAIFSQKQHRQNSCSLYLVATAIFSIIGINWGLGTNMNAVDNRPDSFTISIYLCRIRSYILQSSSLLYKKMILLACIDRFALPSPQIKVRAFSKPNVAFITIGGSTVFGMLISIHLPIFEVISNNQCTTSGSYGFFFSIYFSLLIIRNLKNTRVRVQSLSRAENVRLNVLPKRDISLIKLVLAEVLICIILTTLYPASSLYTILTSNVSNKSSDRIAIESFVYFIVLIVLFYTNYSVAFYLYSAISKANQTVHLFWLQGEELNISHHKHFTRF